MKFKQLLTFPQATLALLYGSLWNAFSLFGTQMFLVLYLMHSFHLSRSEAYVIYGGYAALSFSMPLLGGMLADRWLSSWRTIMLSAMLTILGNLLMASLNRYVFFCGLGAILLGAGFYKSNAAHLVGVVYQSDDPQKESAFTWLYLSINIGATTSAIAYSVVAANIAWNVVFLISAIGMASSLVWLLANVKTLRTTEQSHSVQVRRLSYKPAWFYGLLPLVCLGLGVIFYFPATLNSILIAFFIGTISYLWIKIKQQPAQIRRRLMALFVLSAFTSFFFAASLQTGALLPAFIQANIQAGILAIHLPANIFSSLYALFVIVLAPLFGVLWYWLKQKHITLFIGYKVSIGLGLACLAMLVFALASVSHAMLVWLVLGYMLLSAGEVSLTPAFYTAISDYTNTGMTSTMMGCWFIFIALGGYMASLLAQTSHIVALLLPQKHYHYTLQFLFIAGFTLVISVCLLLWNKTLNQRLMS